jgi:GT2 family glycosyltransferase
MPLPAVCIVVIGRNEAKRLGRTLAAALRSGDPVIYVDSGSSDSSVAVARQLGVTCHELDPGRPFSAARARNEGAEISVRAHPNVEYLQFVDGDSVLSETWLHTALTFMQSRPDVGVVFGALREANPEGSLYNRLCDYEWNPSAPGEVQSCGGNLCVRSDLFVRLQGFRSEMIDSEDNEFGIRVRKAEFKTWYIESLMALHDAGMTRFGQWWRRMYRNGHGLGQLAVLHGQSEPVRLIRSAKVLFWGLAFPAGVLIGTWMLGYWVLLLLALYPLQAVRSFLNTNRRRSDWIYAGFSTLAKVPVSFGIMKYLFDSTGNGTKKIIEYK